MKKRLLSMLLSLCLIAALFCGLSVSAYADNTQEYTVKGGDTIYGICQKLKIDYAANVQWILTTNNIVNANDIKVGTKLTLPASGTKPAAAATAATTTTAAAATGNKLSTGDSVSYYIVDHVMAGGETVYSVCKQLGIDFAANSDRIKTMNGITNYNNVKVGTTVKLPATTAPASGTYTQVVGHKVVAGDTVGALCRNYGIDYASNMNTIKALNNTDNLGSIKVGQTLYLPVKAGTAATTAAAAPAATGAATPAATAPTVNTAAQNGAFNVHTSSNGIFYLTVNGQVVNSAAAGQTVTVVTVPDQGYKVNDIIIYKTSSTERVAVKNSSFVMPSYDITIYVTFRAG